MQSRPSPTDPAMQAMDFNPQLRPWQVAQPSPDPGKGRIEAPGAGSHIRWQTRSAEPTAYELALADAVVQLYAEGLRTPEAFADGLNRLQCRTPSGQTWSADGIRAEMHRLAQ